MGNEKRIIKIFYNFNELFFKVLSIAWQTRNQLAYAKLIKQKSLINLKILDVAQWKEIVVPGTQQKPKSINMHTGGWYR